MSLDMVIIDDAILGEGDGGGVLDEHEDDICNGEEDANNANVDVTAAKEEEEGNINDDVVLRGRRAQERKGSRFSKSNANEMLRKLVEWLITAEGFRR